MSLGKFILIATLVCTGSAAADAAFLQDDCTAPLAVDHPGDGVLSLCALNTQLPSKEGVTISARRISTGRGLPGQLAVITLFSDESGSIDLVPLTCGGTTTHLLTLPPDAIGIAIAVSNTCDVIYYCTRSGTGAGQVMWLRVGSGQGGTLPYAALDAPGGLAVSPEGRFLYAADSGNAPSCDPATSHDKVVRWKIADCLTPPRFALDPSPIADAISPPSDPHAYNDVTLTGSGFGAKSNLVLFNCATVPGEPMVGNCGTTVPFTAENFDNIGQWQSGVQDLFTPGFPTTLCPDERIVRIAGGSCHFYGSSAHKVFAFTEDTAAHALVSLPSGVYDIDVGANDALYIVDAMTLYTVTSGCCPSCDG